jgi:hypothetical protein
MTHNPKANHEAAGAAKHSLKLVLSLSKERTPKREIKNGCIAQPWKIVKNIEPRNYFSNP